MLSASQTIKFDDTRAESGRADICEWGQNGNLSKLDLYVRARYEQYRKLNLPAGAVLCGVEMTSDVQTMQYDDMFYVTFNGYLLASNLGTSVKNRNLTAEPVMAGPIGVAAYKYDWSKIAGAKFDNAKLDDYCLGSGEGISSCVWPMTQQTGSIDLNFAPELLVTLGLKADASNQTFGFIVTGDNDAKDDCYHKELKLKMKAYYYMPQ